MSRIGVLRWSSKAGVVGRPWVGLWLLAVLLVLCDAIQPSHLTSHDLYPSTGTMAGMAASERTDSPSLQARAAFGTIVTETRSLAPGKGLSSDGDTPSAILPVSNPPASRPFLQQPWTASRDQPQSEVRLAFEARAPPSFA